MPDTAPTEQPIRSKPNWLGPAWAWAILLLIPLVDAVGVGVGLLLPAIQAARFASDCEQAISWVRTSHPVPGVYPHIALPDQLHRLADRGTVDAVVLADGRIVLLLKETVGEHERRTGTVWSSAPLKPSEVGQSPYGRGQIQIKGIQNHHITEKIDDRHYRVVLDTD
jgi:hypothetical protein